MPKIIDIDPEALVHDYTTHSLRELSVKHDCSHETVRVYLKRAGVTLRKYTKPKVRLQGRPITLEIPIEEVVKKYEQGYSVRSLAAEHSCSISTIYKNLRASKVAKLRNRLTRASLIERDQQILDHWEYIGGTHEEVGQLFNLGPERIKQILKKGKAR